MTTVYVEEILSDDEGPDTHHDGEEVEVLAPCELPVHTLTSDMVAAHIAGAAAEAGRTPSSDAPPRPTEASANTPEAAEALRLRGNTAFGAKRFEEALKLYSDAIVIDGANGLLYGNRSATLMQLGRAQQAVDDARQMVLLLPDLAKAHFRLGAALSASGQPADAAKALLSAVELDPSSEPIAEALKKELARPALKKGKQHAPLVQACQQALTARTGGGGGGGGGAALPRLPWKEAVTSAGFRPAKRGGAVLCAAVGRLWLIGGADRGGATYDDVWEYCPQHSRFASEVAGWRQHSAGSGFRARAGHAACSVPPSAVEDAANGSEIYVFGGQDPASSVLLDDLSVLNVFPAAANANAIATWEQSTPTPLGSTPEARNGHSFTLDPPERSLLLFGGADSEGHRADVHRLVLPAATVVAAAGGADGLPAKWEAPSVSGPKPAAREMHVAAVLAGRRRLIVHGGRGGDELLGDVCVLSLDTWTWEPSVPSQCTRVGHTLAMIPPAAPTAATGGAVDVSEGASEIADGRLLIFGGFSGDAMCNDTQELTISSAGEAQLSRVPADSSPPRRFAHCTAVLGGVVYIFGGSAATADLDDLHGADAAATFAARSA